MTTWKDFKNAHKVSDFLIMGLGSSLNLYDPMVYKQFMTIGVNDIEKTGITPDYLVFLDRPEDLDKRDKSSDWSKKFSYIVNSDARYVFLKKYQYLLDHGYIKPDNKFIELETHNYKRKVYEPDKIIHYKTSIIPSICLAIWMGASSITLIGVDHDGEYSSAYADNFSNNEIAAWTDPIKSVFHHLMINNPHIGFFNASPYSKIDCYKYKDIS